LKVYHHNPSFLLRRSLQNLGANRRQKAARVVLTFLMTGKNKRRKRKKATIKYAPGFAERRWQHDAARERPGGATP
jgi:hypothetical protein